MSAANHVRGPEAPRDDYDVVIVGAGFAGALIAQRLANAGKKILMLEAGRSTSITPQGYASYVGTYHGALAKGPNSPYPENPNAGSPRTPDYWVQLGPQVFGSDYVRAKGGTSLHWLGTCLRMVPADFLLKSLYGVGCDWPLSYDQLEGYYREAERAIGVSADVEDQSYLGIRFPRDYVFPMRKIPQSYLDSVAIEKIAGMQYRQGAQTFDINFTSTPQGRNSIPNPLYDGGRGYQPVGAAGDSDRGQRCEGNSSCIPICPAQAKYSALKTLAAIPADRCHIITQAVASQVLLDLNGRISGIAYKAYPDESSGNHTEHVAHGKLYLLAGNAVENAKLMLSSPKVCRRSGQLGRNLMDHPYVLAWGLMPEPIGAGRGPSSTSGVEILRDGAFRSAFAAFRMEICNWGWEFPTGSPYSDAGQRVGEGLFGSALRRDLEGQLPRQFRLGFLMEQLPDTSNCVTIDPRYLDPLGNFRPVIQYSIDRYTRAGIEQAFQFKDAVMRRLGAEDHTSNSPLFAAPVEYNGVTYGYYGAGHLIGTHRMGNAATDSVVNVDGLSWEHDNLYLAGCGNMPTAATSNPSLTMSALALKTADGMIRRLEGTWQS